jgi:NAD(P)-dependent dehydrogenase (short-subunit alcohol dehydrogenase family)
MDLEGRRFIVTGAASGIGRTTAVLLSRLKAEVICADINEPELRVTFSLLAGKGHVLAPYDFRNVDGIPEWMRAQTVDSGPLSGLVHAAGITCIASSRLMTTGQWRELFLVNTEAALALTKGFQTRGVYVGAKGSIVFISSIMGTVGSPGAAAYGSSKGALDAMARSLALELATKRIRVNCVAPAFVRTPMFERMAQRWSATQRSQVEALHPLGLGEPEDVAGAIAFLLSDAARWITGTVLTVDGGYTAQ